MRKLCVPNELIGVECLVAVSPFAEHVEVCRQVGAPWEGDSGVASIGEVPCGEIARSLQLVFGMCICGIAVDREVEPTVAETK